MLGRRLKWRRVANLVLLRPQHHLLAVAIGALRLLRGALRASGRAVGQCRHGVLARLALQLPPRLYGGLVLLRTARKRQEHECEEDVP